MSATFFRRTLFGASTIICLSSLLLIASCRDDPTAADPVTATSTGRVDPAGAKDFLLGSVNLSDNTGRIEVWAFDLERDGDDVSFNTVLVNRSSRALYPPVYFIITSLLPAGVTVTNADTEIDGDPAFDYSDFLGDVPRLDPGETSSPVLMKFNTPDGGSFALGFDIQSGEPTPLLSGTVFSDMNQNGVREANEPGVPRIRVFVHDFIREGTLPPEILRTAVTNEDGEYWFNELFPGLQEVRVEPRAGSRVTTDNPLLVTLLTDDDGNIVPLDGVDFGLFMPEPPDSLPGVLFGPAPVGPGTFIGTELLGGFSGVSTNPNEFFVLDVIPPPILSPELLRIDVARVTINNRVVFEFECETNTGPCLPAGQFRIPEDVIEPGENVIHILTEGSQRAFLIYTVRVTNSLIDPPR